MNVEEATARPHLV